MVSKQTVQVLIEAEENVSKVAKKAEDAVKKIGNAGQNGLSKLSSITSRVSSGFSKLTSWVNSAREKFTAFTSSSNKLGMIRSAINGAAGSFGQLVNNSNLASRAMEKIKSVSDGIQAKFTNLQSKITGFGSSVKTSLTNAFSMSNIKSKLSSLGGSIDSLKAKLKTLSAEAKKTGGAGGLGFLRSAASMTVGMFGYDLVGSIMETTKASLNARSSMQAFASRLKMNSSEVADYQKSLDDLQSTFKKVDMDVVGQQATDMAYRLGLPKTSLTELTETTAIFNDAMMRNGRSSEDAMMAMADAMDGQFVRLKEIGISQEDLMKNGWSGDINDKTGLLNAMNKSLKEQHYDDLAKSVDTLDDAWQVLSVTLGNLVETILVPLTPVIVGIINGLMGAVEGIKGFITILQEAFNGLPDWAKYGIAIAALAVGVGFAIAAFGGLEAVLVTLLGPLFSVAGAITAISLPIVAVVAAVGLLVVAIYEIGKAFGWWSDVGTMFEAISAGIQRLWSAFINHPDVQAAISMISNAVSILGSWIQQAGEALLEFFGVASGGDFDIVLAIMEVVGLAWDAFKDKIQTAIFIVTTLWNAINTAFTAIWGVVGPIVMEIVRLVQRLILIWDLFKTGQISLPQLIMSVLSQIGVTYTNIMGYIVNLVIKFASQMLQKAIQAGRNFVNGIINRIKALPGQIYSALVQVVSRIISAGAMWVRAAKQKAKEIVDGAYNTLTGLPGRIASALGGVKDAIVKPFQDAYNTAKGWWDKIASLDIGGTAGFDLGNTAGFDLGSSSGSSSTEHHETIDVNYNISLDLSSVPGGMNTTELINALTDKTVLAALTGNRDFQTLDAKVKSRINQKNSRAYGRGV